ncbi:MAG: hypothetical protein LBB89_10085 [Treponema sp.]|jgi:hypothetical protein|nr:hypothetical protein [Treponema sp.]
MNLIISKKSRAFAALLFMTAALFAQRETGPRILVRSSPERPITGSTWTLTLLIAHDEPGEVDVLAPHFTGSLLLEQVVKSPRFLNPVTGQFSVNNPVNTEVENNAAMPMAFERWTAMEYRFVLNNPGTINFDAFTVITPRGQIKTDPFILNVQRPRNTAEAHTYQLEWEGIPSGLKIGENAVFALRINNWDSANSAPEARLFLPPVPPGYILESLPLRAEEKSAGIAIRLRLIPLEIKSFVLERRRFSHGGNNFEIPALRIPVTARIPASEAVSSRTAAHIQAQEQTAPEVPPFPSLETAQKDNLRLYQKHQTECENIYRTAKDLWENGYFAGALAALRRNERDHPAGAFFAVLRRGAEQVLGFTGTNDEKRRRLWRGPLWFFLGEKSRSAVLRETAVRRIPDAAGEEIARFREGQPVLLDPQTQKQRETWLRIMVNDDNETSGWVPKENIIIY